MPDGEGRYDGPRMVNEAVLHQGRRSFWPGCSHQGRPDQGSSGQRSTDQWCSEQRSSVQARPNELN